MPAKGADAPINQSCEAHHPARPHPPQGGLVGGGPRVGKLDDQVGEAVPGDPGEATMGQGRAGPCWRGHPRMMPL